MKLKKYPIIVEHLVKLNLNVDWFNEVLIRYDESHRVYHTDDHIADMIKDANCTNMLTDDLLLAIVFHDAVYERGSTMDEEDSAELMQKVLDGKISKKRIDEIYDAILSTKDHKGVSKLSDDLITLDLATILGDYKTFVIANRKIFKEYQHVDFADYKEGQIKILKRLGAKKDFIQYVELLQPKIGIYPGSFNPFHKGHLNILEKAEKIFDKVIIAKGCNPSKEPIKQYDIPEVLENRQCEVYTGLLSDFVQEFEEQDITVIRGLRNAADFEAEKIQYRYLTEQLPKIKVVNIICDNEYDHISSSAIRQLRRYRKHKQYIV